MFHKLTPTVYLENDIKHTNTIEESEVFLSVYFHRKQYGAEIYGDFWSEYPLNFLTRAQTSRWRHSGFCFPNMVLCVRWNFPGNEQTNDKQKFLRSLLADWLLFHTARKFKFASRPSMIIPSSAFLYIASACSFISFAFVSSYSVVHHAWCRQLYSQERQH